jgi:integrase
MGHNTRKMVNEVYGKYRKGLVEERERILEFMGEDFLAL